MKTLRPLTPDKLARAEYRLLHPAPGGRIEAARNYGIDLTLLVEQLRLTRPSGQESWGEASSCLDVSSTGSSHQPAPED